MAITVETLRNWLETLDGDSDVWVDGTVLRNKGENYEAYVEIGEERDDGQMRCCV